MDADVIVVGAGPAGSSTAYHLARRGRRVLLLERHRFPRDKSCGDGLTRFAASQLAAMGVLAELQDAQVACGVRVVMRGRGHRDFEYPPGLTSPAAGLVVPRHRLDEVLARRAVSAGAELREATLVSGLVQEDGVVVGVHAMHAGQATVLRAPFVVAADGAASRLAAEAGLHGTPADRLGIAVRGYYTGIEGLTPLLEIFTPLLDATDRYLLPSYGWIFPIGSDRANVGVGLFERQQDVNVRELFERFMGVLAREDARFARARPCSPWKGAPLRFDFAPDRCAAPGLVVVGDAAGLISPFTGEGIGYALHSGKLAAECMDEKWRTTPGSTRQLSTYPARLAKDYTGYFETGRESARRYRLVWHLLESTFRNEQPLFVLCRQVALFPEGLGQSFTDAALDDVSDRVIHAGLPLRADLVAVDELLVDTVRRDWPFLARALAVGQHERGIPFRPALLLLLASYLGTGDGSVARGAALRASAAIELGFMSALAHFSVQDEDPCVASDSLPRTSEGQPSPHARAATATPAANWGNMIALLVGDYLLAEAHALGASIATRVTAMIAEALALACEARVSELRRPMEAGWSDAAYLELTQRKTAPFFELPCRIGALLGALSPSHIAALGRYGRCLGLAYALTDEAMLVGGCARKLARVIGLRADERATGMPLLIALQQGGADAGVVRGLLRQARSGEADARACAAARIAATLRDCGAVAETLRRARVHSQEAREALAGLADGPIVRSLEALAMYASDAGDGERPP